MKAILEFNLPEEQDSFDKAANAWKMWLAISEFDNKLRGWVKYEHNFNNPEEALHETRRLLHELLSEENISLHQ